jgi:hypothetical protein
MYKARRITKQEILKICKSIQDENLKILGVVKSDNMLFKKKKIHYELLVSDLRSPFKIF